MYKLQVDIRMTALTCRDGCIYLMASRDVSASRVASHV